MELRCTLSTRLRRTLWLTFVCVLVGFHQVPVNGLELGSDCSGVSDCGDPNSVCNVTCLCNEDFFDSNAETLGGVCVPARELGGACSGPGQCAGDNAVCVQYACACGAGFYDSNGWLSGGSCENVTRLQVADVQFTSIGTSSLGLEWKAPNDSHVVNEYMVTWYPSNHSLGSRDRGSGTTHMLSSAHIENLVPGQVYTIRIESINIMTATDPRTTFVTTEHATGAAVPGPVDPERSEFRARKFMITWHVHPGSLASLYHVTLLEEETVLYSSEGVQNSLLFPEGVRNGLLNGHRYVVSLYAESLPFILNGLNVTVASDVFNQTVKTEVTAPSPPRDVYCQTQGQDPAVRLTWLAPTHANGDLTGYLIQVYEYGVAEEPVRTVRMGAKDTEALLDNLKTGWAYRIRVYAVNEKYESFNGTFARTEDGLGYCQTEAGEAGPVSSPSTNVTSRSATLEWTNPEQTNGQLYGYVASLSDHGGQCVREAVWTCLNVYPCFGTVPGISPQCPSLSRAVTHDVNRSSLLEPQSFTVASLLPDTSYTVRVAAVNRHGVGQETQLSIQTSQEAPQKPYDVIASNIQPTSVSLDWTIDGPRPGPTTYRVQLVAEEPAISHFKTIDGFGVRSLEFSGLEEYWNYSVLVNASTAVGSNISDAVQFRTKLSKPGEVQNLTVITIADRYDQRQVRWSPPGVLDHNGVIDKYLLVLDRNSSQQAPSTFSIDAKSYQSDGAYVKNVTVMPGNNYVVEVLAVNTEEEHGAPVRLVFHTQTEPVPESQQRDRTIIILVCVIGIVAIIVLLVVVILIRRRQRRIRRQHCPSVPAPPEMELRPEMRKKATPKTVNGKENDAFILPTEDVRKSMFELDHLEVNFNCLDISADKLGTGRYGDVYRGVLKREDESAVMVAIKSFTNTSSVFESKRFKKEIGKFESIGDHPNIVPLLGYCCINGRVYLAHAYQATGSLLAYLRSCRPMSRQMYSLEEGTADPQTTTGVSQQQMLAFMVDIVHGMRHLASKQIVHGNLAARNVLLDDCLVAKVVDYGISHPGESAQSKKAPGRLNQSQMYGRWQAIESLSHGAVNTQTDIWAYGVLQWEIVTLGGTPYYAMTAKDLLEKLLSGYRLPKPENCGYDLYDLMLQCWEENPNNRPSFEAIGNVLKRLSTAKKVLVNLSGDNTEAFSQADV